MDYEYKDSLSLVPLIIPVGDAMFVVIFIFNRSVVTINTPYRSRTTTIWLAVAVIQNKDAFPYFHLPKQLYKEHLCKGRAYMKNHNKQIKQIA